MTPNRLLCTREFTALSRKLVTRFEGEDSDAWRTKSPRQLGGMDLKNISTFHVLLNDHRLPEGIVSRTVGHELLSCHELQRKQCQLRPKEHRVCKNRALGRMGGHVQQKVNGMNWLIGQGRDSAINDGSWFFRSEVLQEEPG